MPSKKRSWEEIKREILARLNIIDEYRALGVRFAKTTPNAKGFVPCYAHESERVDSDPSACVNVVSGRYKDSGGDGLSVSLWDAAVRWGAFPDWQTARKHYAQRAGVKLSKGRPPGSPTKHLKFLPWVDDLVQLWCLKHKPGITAEAVRAFGGRLCLYREQYHCIALPILGVAGADAEPVGWHLHRSNGGKLPIFHGKGKPPSWRKEKITYGSEPGLIGLHGVERLRDPDHQVTVAWKTAGPTDAMALWSIIPEELRETHLVVTNSNGEGEPPQPGFAPLFAGRRACLIHDADNPGEAGAVKWAPWLAEHADKAWHVRLPYEIAEKHGKDLRDYVQEGRGYDDLMELVKAAGTITVGEKAEATYQPIEADDDPHRLAKAFLHNEAYHSDYGCTLKYWQEDWWQWISTHYQRIREAEMRGRVNMSIKAEFDRLNVEAQQNPSEGEEIPETRKVTVSVVNNTLAALVGHTMIPSTIDQPSWLDKREASPNCIALQNGILDVDRLLARRDDFWTEHTPEWFSPIVLPYPFDPDADCPTWKRTLWENMEGDQECLDLMQEIAGYCLLHDTSLQKFFFLHGDGGSGKSVYCAGLVAMLGTDNVSHVRLEDFSNRFSLYGTLGKLANIITEVGEIDKIEEGVLKGYTVGDRMAFDRKGKAPVEASPTARLILAANSRPRFTDRTYGLWRRMILLPFNRRIPEEKQVKKMDEWQWWWRKGECPGVFNWALGGLVQLRKQGRFTLPKICREAIEEYRMEIDPARAFLLENCEGNTQANVGVDDLYHAYAGWCKKSNYRPLGKAEFGKSVKRLFPGAEKKRIGPKSDRFHVYAGVQCHADF